MGKQLDPATDEDDRELTGEELARMRPAKDVLRPELYAGLTKRKSGQRGPGKKPAKIQTSIRLDPIVIAAFKANGSDWQKDVNAVLLREVQRREKPGVPRTSTKKVSARRA